MWYFHSAHLEFFFVRGGAFFGHTDFCIKGYAEANQSIIQSSAFHQVTTLLTLSIKLSTMKVKQHFIHPNYPLSCEYFAGFVLIQVWCRCVSVLVCTLCCFLAMQIEKSEVEFHSYRSNNQLFVSSICRFSSAWSSLRSSHQPVQHLVACWAAAAAAAAAEAVIPAVPPDQELLRS